ncbi:MAG: hypothetical protein ABS87_11265 [Sphingomonas sp. SCN 67-18]|uniref:hypothetical protein n=1 Tax=uncultured Sphingomonas sp. TaxID=158754 RepID=UPI00086A8066|nr:hypothetical protein [Sphingomonas sp. SCN 67-18]ODU20284.1 MAG: hypothetical protein ABS87_11265 [Sphingomonas sp. SCN 67-18]
MFPKSKPLVACAALFALAACAKDGDLDSTGGISVTRSACPAVGVPASTGDITLFNPPSSRDARAMDVTATITNIRTNCGESGSDIVSTSTFDVQARRADASGARQLVLPYFATVVRGGNVVVSKRVGQVTLNFADGEARASAQGEGSAVINRAAATLPEDINARIVRKRKPGDADAAIDPMNDPTVRQAVARASFELLIGFQLTGEQLQYNATR